MRNIAGNSPIFPPSVTPKAGAKVLLFSQLAKVLGHYFSFFVIFAKINEE